MRQVNASALFLGFVLCVSGVTTAQTFSFATEFTAQDEHRVVGADATLDGGFVLAFQSDRFDSQPPDDFSVVVKLDEYGAVLWERRISGDHPGGPIHAIDAAADGTLLIAGRVNGRRGDADVWIARLDAQGEILWQRAVGGPWDEVATAVQATWDGGAVVVGQAERPGPNGRDLLVLKFSPDGEIEWARLLGTSDDESASDVREIDGGYFVVGSQNDLGLALRLGSAGQIEWARRSKTHGFDGLALSGVDGGFAAVSHPNRLTRIGEEGEFIWQRAYLGVDSLAKVSESDFGFLLGGSTDFWWAAGVTDMGDAIWTSEIVISGGPFLGEVRGIVGLPGGGSFTVAEMRIPEFIWAHRLNENGLACSFPSPHGDFSVDRLSALTPVSLESRAANGLTLRESDYASQTSSPIWGDATVCPN